MVLEGCDTAEVLRGRIPYRFLTWDLGRKRRTVGRMGGTSKAKGRGKHQLRARGSEWGRTWGSTKML
jgi:hypothetical protein